MRVVAQARSRSKLEGYKGPVNAWGHALSCAQPAPDLSGRRVAVYTQPMKVIGPYVISATPVGAAVHGQPGSTSFPSTPESGPSAWNRPGSGAPPAVDRALPLHGVDRLTGMPVLLHRLTAFLVPVSLPDSPFLLPVSEVDVWDAQPYAVTELPPAAVPADHPGTAAPGVLQALAALHAAGLVHGGLNAGQFWQVGREVRLAGAGLPWTPGATPADDMKALAQALDTLGARPAALRGLETMNAAQALAALDAALARVAPDRPIETAATLPAGPVPAPPSQATPAQVSTVQAAPLQVTAPLQVRPERRDTPPAGAPVVPLAQPSAGAAVPSPASAPEPRHTAPAKPRRRWDDRPDRQAAERRSEEPRRLAAPAGTLEQDAPAAGAPATAPKPTGIQPEPSLAAPSEVPATPEAPRTYRSAGDTIVLGEDDPASQEAASEVPAEHSAAAPTPAAAPSVAAPVVAAPSQLAPDPILIGFDDLPDLPTDWTPEAAHGAVAARTTGAGPESLTAAPSTAPSTPSGEAAPNPGSDGEATRPERSSGRTTRYTPTDARPAGGRLPTGTPTAAGDPATAGGPRKQALRIGWEEDHSWRVVKSVEEARSPRARRPLWPLAVLVLAVLAGAAYWWSGRSAAPAAACCSQQFTVLGSKLPVKVTLVQAPPGSPLQPGAMIGTAPGLLRFPDAPGVYTLRFSAEGHGALTGAVTVPSDQAFSIMLK